MAKKRVLVVEDSSVVRNIIRLQLEVAGFSAVVASNGQEAWDAARRDLFDLVITDEQMPVMTGQELCRLLRSDDRYSSTPIIFVTCKQLELDELEDLSIAAVIGKPFSPALLPSAVQEVLGQCTGSAAATSRA